MARYMSHDHKSYGIIRNAAVHKTFVPEYYVLCKNLMAIAKKFNAHAWYHIENGTRSHDGGYLFGSMMVVGITIPRKIIRDEVCHVVAKSMHLSTDGNDSPAWETLMDTMISNVFAMEIAHRLFSVTTLFDDRVQLKELKASIQNVGLTKFEPGELAVYTYQNNMALPAKEKSLFEECEYPPERLMSECEVWMKAIEVIANHLEIAHPLIGPYNIYVNEGDHHPRNFPTIRKVVTAFTDLS